MEPCCYRLLATPICSYAPLLLIMTHSWGNVPWCFCCPLFIQDCGLKLSDILQKHVSMLHKLDECWMLKIFQPLFFFQFFFFFLWSLYTFWVQTCLSSVSFLQTSPDLFCTKDRTRDVDAIYQVIQSAKTFIFISVTNYLPLVSRSFRGTSVTRYWVWHQNAICSRALTFKCFFVTVFMRLAHVHTCNKYENTICVYE